VNKYPFAPPRNLANIAFYNRPCDERYLISANEQRRRTSMVANGQQTLIARVPLNTAARQIDKLSIASSEDLAVDRAKSKV
jgi:hypothetical protein